MERGNKEYFEHVNKLMRELKKITTVKKE